MNAVEAAILIMMDFHEGAGRYYLAKLSGLGEGFIRDRLNELRAKGLVESKRSGSYLTQRGRMELRRYLDEVGIRKLIQIDLSRLLRARHAACMVAVAKMVPKDVVGLRDELVRHGCKAAVIMRNECGDVVIPMTPFKVSDMDAELSRNLKEASECGDSLIGVCGDNEFINIMAILSVELGAPA
ncbi:hypothetical protein GCM10007981_03040 [Thermocladium modestius]|uniref:DUF4443 domain-containing protein n=1 Tax=Thermocladium modestius TaxID=62609 RepID=A0A830GTF3_9CREN|nr:DUF4443 domain-containing protein [Thermocladium modestius]GGP19422.1 hypothetical protein GCM10007981_03040 [Thermocladium modestius]